MSKESLHMLFLLLILGMGLCRGHEGNTGSCSSSAIPEAPPIDHHHHCGGHDHHHHHQHYDSHVVSKLPEELAEEEDLKLYGFSSDHDHDHHSPASQDLSNFTLWVYAMGCSLLVSMASLICLIMLPVICFKGKPSKTVVDSLAAFGAGAMLGDAFLHQLPHAFGGEHSHSHEGHLEHNHDHSHIVQSHSHSLKDLSVGLSILSGIILFLLVEKVVRYVEDYSGKEASAWGHSHHHGHKKIKLKDDHDESSQASTMKNDETSDMSSEGKMRNGVSDAFLTERNHVKPEPFLPQSGASDVNKPELDATVGSIIHSGESGSGPSSSNLVFGYLNLFSDGVHNFTDGMALGSAFLLHGSVGGWSRTLFLLAHELPQEVGDFGILVRSGFSVSKALFFNFLSALVALAGTALALLLGKDPGQSALIEGFTAGGFIYIAVAGVLPEMNNSNSTFRSFTVQLTWLILGMAVALCISLVE